MVSHLKDQIKIIQQVGTGKLCKSSSLHWKGEYRVLECCWSLVHFSEVNMKFSSVISRTVVYTDEEKSINAVQFWSALKEKCYFLYFRLCSVTSGCDSVVCQKGWGESECSGIDNRRKIGLVQGLVNPIHVQLVYNYRQGSQRKTLHIYHCHCYLLSLKAF